MEKDKKIVAVFGTRPEAIKLFPVLRIDKKIETIFTGQHVDLTKNICDELNIRIDRECCIKEPYTLTSLIADLAPQLEWHFNKIIPDIVIVQGDTISAYIGALVAWMKGIDVAHIEAGLRTDTLYSPYPEEFFRRSIDTMAKYQFAPTERAYKILQEENKSLKDEKILIKSGNTIVDAVRIAERKHTIKLHRNRKEFILCLLHRNENVKNGIKNIYKAINTISKKNRVIMIKHPTPALSMIDNIISSRVDIINPIGYFGMIHLIKNCKCIISDSGGLSEEAVCLDKPILITRAETERKEAIEYGVGHLVGCNTKNIVNKFNKINDNILEVTKDFPFGYGDASKIIVGVLKNRRK